MFSLSRSMKNTSASWTALEEVEDDVEEDEERIDIELEAEELGDVFELF